MREDIGDRTAIACFSCRGHACVNSSGNKGRYLCAIILSLCISSLYTFSVEQLTCCMILTCKEAS